MGSIHKPYLEGPLQQTKHLKFQLKPRSSMARVSTSRYFAALSLLILFSKTVSAYPNSTFDFKNFDKDSKFELQLALYGDAKVVNGSSSVQITGSSLGLSAGRVFYKKPIKLVEGSPREYVSFSTYFSFSMSAEIGDGLAFAIVPIGFPLKVFDGGSFGLLSDQKIRTLVVEFDTLMDHKYDDLNGNHVGIDIDGLVSVKVSNVSSINLVLNSGEKLQAWIDYEAGSKRLEVRLSKIGEMRPVDPLLSFPIDLSSMWKEKVYVGLSSSNANSSQTSNVYSWSFRLRRFPHWMHSQPLDPMTFSDKTRTLTVCKRRDCLSRIIAALIFGTACGALGALIVLLVWTLLANRRRPVVPEEYTAQPVGFKYEKFKVVVDKAIEDGKK